MCGGAQYLLVHLLHVVVMGRREGGMRRTAWTDGLMERLMESSGDVASTCWCISTHCRSRWSSCIAWCCSMCGGALVPWLLHCMYWWRSCIAWCCYHQCVCVVVPLLCYGDVVSTSTSMILLYSIDLHALSAAKDLVPQCCINRKDRRPRYSHVITST